MKDELPNVSALALCRGVDPAGKPCLSKPIKVRLTAVLFVGAWDVSVDCRYNTGSHGHRCRASHPRVEKLGDGVLCALVGHGSAPGGMVTDPDPNATGQDQEGA